MANFYNAQYQQPPLSSPPPTHINALFNPTVTVTITMRNMGDTDWYPPGIPGEIPTRLGSENPPDNMTWNFNRVDLTRPVSKGDDYTFTLTIDPTLLTPPAGNKPRVYNFQWRMVQDGGVGWFGDYTPNVAITVVDPNV